MQEIKKILHQVEDNVAFCVKINEHPYLIGWFVVYTRIPRKASSHLLGQKSQEPQSERGN